jgi:hypothetical protein
MKELLKYPWVVICTGIVIGYLVFWLTGWFMLGAMILAAPMVHYYFKLFERKDED